MTRYFTYSSLIHAVVVSFLIFSSLFSVKRKDYYTVDFMGAGGSAGSPGGGESMQMEEKKPEAQKPAPPKPVEKVKTRVVNPKEDLLMKSKQKPKEKEKVVVSEIPSAPPVPSLKEVPSKSASAGSAPIPSAGGGVSAVPGSGVGGIGFGDGGGGSGGSGNFPYTWYVHSIKKKLDSNWNVTSGFSNKIFTQVAFTITRGGSIANVEVEESSGDSVFDQAAVRAVQYSSPLPPLPGDFDEPELRVHVRFSVKR